MVSKFFSLINEDQNNRLLLQKKLMSMLNKYFNLRMKLKMGQLKQLHLLKKSRSSIACLKLVLLKLDKINRK